MELDKSKNLVLSLLTLKKLNESKQISLYTHARFEGHLMRVLRLKEPEELLPLGKEIVQSKEDYFWSRIVNEILEWYSIDNLARQVHAEFTFIHAIAERNIRQLEMPFLIGEKLLELHNRIRPDLQKIEENYVPQQAFC